MMEALQALAGHTIEAEQTVTEDFTASHIGSGRLQVYATPAMVAFVERTASDLCQSVLPQGYTSVGVTLNVRHLAPTPIGKQIRLRLTVREIVENRIRFTATLQDELEPIGEVDHERVVVDLARFLKRVDSKA
jgi:predicted thioesterase